MTMKQPAILASADRAEARAAQLSEASALLRRQGQVAASSAFDRQAEQQRAEANRFRAMADDDRSRIVNRAA